MKQKREKLGPFFWVFTAGGGIRSIVWRWKRWRRGRGRCLMCKQMTSDLEMGTASGVASDGNVWLTCPPCTQHHEEDMKRRTWFRETIDDWLAKKESKPEPPRKVHPFVDPLDTEPSNKQGQCPDCETWHPLVWCYVGGMGGLWWKDSDGCPGCGAIVCVESECNIRKKS